MCYSRYSQNYARVQALVPEGRGKVVGTILDGDERGFEYLVGVADRRTGYSAFDQKLEYRDDSRIKSWRTGTTLRRQTSNEGTANRALRDLPRYTGKIWRQIYAPYMLQYIEP